MRDRRTARQLMQRHQLIRCSVAWLLLAQVALWAIAPAPLLMLAGHGHIVIGVVTPQQWRLHQQAHLLEAMHQGYAQPSSHHAGTANDAEAQIFSTGDRHSAVSTLRGETIVIPPPACACKDHADREETLPDLKPSIARLALDVPHPPPRLAAI